MRLYFDLDRQIFVSGPGTNERQDRLEAKRGDSMNVVLQFCRGITINELGAEAEGRIGAKESGDYDGNYVAVATSWTKAGSGSSTTYSFDLSLNTSELNALLGVGEGEDVAFVDLMFELEFEDAGIVTSSNTATLRVHNDVNRGTEDSPTELPTPDDWLSARAVRYDEAQSLSSGEKTQARSNVGITLSGGGNGAADSGKVPTFDEDGALAASNLVAVIDSSGGSRSMSIDLSGGEQALEATNNGHVARLVMPVLTANRLINVPDATGKMVLGDGSGIDNPSDFRAALQTRLPVVLNEERLDFFSKASQAFEVAGMPAAGTYLGVGAFGDSMGDLTAAWIVRECVRRFGLGSLSTAKFAGGLLESANDVLTETASGGATDLAGVPGLNGYSPQSTAWELPSGGKVTVTKHASANLQGPWKKVQIWYMTRAGGGDLTVNVIQNGSTVYTTVIDTDWTAGMGVLEVDESDGLLCGVSPTVEVIAAVADCYYLGTIYFADRGVVPLCHCRGGATLEVQNTVPTDVLDLFQANVPMHLMIHSMKEDETSEPDPLMPETALHMARMQGHFGACSHVFIGQSPTAADESLDASRSLRLRELCLLNDFAYLDGYQAAKDYANVTALGWNNDGTHLLTNFWRYIASVFLARVSVIYNPGSAMANSLARRQMLSGLAERIPAFWTGTLTNQYLTGTGATYSAQNAWRYMTSGASTGSAAGTILVGRASPNRLMTPARDFVFLWQSVGNAFVASGRGWFQFGCGDANYAAPDKTRLSFGVDIALPSNVGLSDSTNHAYRIWAYDGTTLFESAWGATPSLSASLTIKNLLLWDYATETFQLRAQGAGVSSPAMPLVAALRVPGFAAKTLQGQNVIMGAVSTVAGETATMSLPSPPECIYPDRALPMGLF